MKVLDEQDGIDSELLVFAMTLINKTMYGIPDQDTFYDVADALEMQNIDKIQERYRSKKGLDKKGTESLKSQIKKMILNLHLTFHLLGLVSCLFLNEKT